MKRLALLLPLLALEPMQSFQKGIEPPVVRRDARQPEGDDPDGRRGDEGDAAGA